MTEVVLEQTWPNPVVGEIQSALGVVGHAQLNERITSQLARSETSEATVVIVGETKTGKSSLVNALLQRDGLVPVGADVATNVHIILRGGERDQVYVHLDDDRQLQQDSLDLTLWASVAGNRDNAKGVRAVEVQLAHPLLERGLTLIDTPGVGGLDTAHGRQTLAALQDADALVFVADSDRPMLQPELEFLRTAAERIESVIFVYSKIDVHPGWRQIMAENGAALQSYAPRFATAPAIAVSSTLALLAGHWREGGRPEPDIAQLEAESGIGGLRDFLVQHVVDRVEHARRLNVLRLCLLALDALEEPEHAVTRADPELLEQLRGEEGRLDELERASAIWPQRVNDAFMRLRGRMQGELSDLTRDLSRRYGDEGLKPYFGNAEALRDALLRELAALAAELSNKLRDGVLGIEQDVAAALEPAGVKTGGADLDAADRLGALDVDLTGGPDRITDGTRVRNVRLGYSAISQGMSFTSIGHLGFMAVLGVSATSFFGLGIGFGAALAIAEGVQHRRQAKLNDLRPLVNEAGTIAQSKLNLQVQDALLALQRSLEADTRRRIREEQAAAADARKRCADQLNAPPEERRHALALAQHRLSLLAGYRERAEAAMQELSFALHSPVGG